MLEPSCHVNVTPFAAVLSLSLARLMGGLGFVAAKTATAELNKLYPIALRAAI